MTMLLKRDEQQSDRSSYSITITYDGRSDDARIAIADAVVALEDAVRIANRDLELQYPLATTPNIEMVVAIQTQSTTVISLRNDNGLD